MENEAEEGNQLSESLEGEVQEVQVSEEDQEVLDNICKEIAQRPHLALPLLEWLTPDVSFAPSKVLTGPGSKRFTGTLSYTHPGKGFSFIRSQEAKELFGIDVFLHSAQRGNFQLNDDVNFAVLLNKEGKPQAFDLVPAGMPHDQSLGLGTSPPIQKAPWNQKGGKVHGQFTVPPTAPSSLKGGSGKGCAPLSQKGSAGAAQKGGTMSDRPIGVITSFLPAKNYGFIQCPEVHALYGKDVWLHGEQLGAFNIGDTVSFTVIENKGNPQAVDLQAPGKNNHSYSSAGQKRAAPMARNDSDQYVGDITAFYPQKGYGFIHCAEVHDMYGKDVWLHAAQLGAFNVGDTVSFTLVLNKDGNPQGIDLQAPGKINYSYSGAGQKRAAPMTRKDSDQYVGDITAFYPAKGFGFIHCAEVHEMYGKDLWVHSAQIGSFNVGESVSFTLILNKDGNPQAIDLQAAGSGPPKWSRTTEFY